MNNKANKTRSLFVLLPMSEVGGHERMLLTWLPELINHGVKPIVYCEQDTELSKLVDSAGLKQRSLGVLPQNGKSYRSRYHAGMWAAYKALALIPKKAPILIAPGVMQSHLLLLLVMRLMRRKTLVYVPMVHRSKTLGASYAPIRDWLTYQIGKGVLAWITVSEAQSSLLSKYWKFSNITVIPNRLTDSKEVNQCVSVSNNRLRIIYLGRFEAWQKGLDWLYNILLSNQMLDAKMIMQGRGPFYSRFKELEKILGSERIELREWGDASTSFSDVDLLMLTSRYEGFPLVAIEALQNNVAVIATEESGLEDVLPAECRFNFGDTQALNAILRQMLDAKVRNLLRMKSQKNLIELLSLSAYQNGIARVARIIILCSLPSEIRSD